jgi:type VII secretion-associated serine protease mycosin
MMRKVLPVAVLLLVATPLPGNAQPGVLRPGQECLGTPPGKITEVPWAQRQLAPQRVWPLTRGGGVTVGVVDTGVDAASPQLAGRVREGLDVRNPGGKPANNDCFGHGTFVAGIIAAATADDTLFAGVAPDTTILPIRVANEAKDASATSLAQGIRVAVDGGARVINVSASAGGPTPELTAAVAYAAERDVLIVAASGNNDNNSSPTPYPATDKSVLAVGAVDQEGKRASFSLTGPHLGVVAPGVNVCSIGPGGPGQWEASGTSYAAPFVTGVAALVRAYHPKLTAAQVSYRLRATADRPPANLPSPEYGLGTVNPQAAVTAVLPEEGQAGAVVAPVPAAASFPVPPWQDRASTLLVTLGLIGAAVLVLAVGFAVLVLPAGRRRRWAPARRLDVKTGD